MESLRSYLNSLSLPQQEAFAAAVGTSVGYLRKACSIGQRLGADLCIAIERESRGTVRVEVLRPDVDWAYLRGSSLPATADPGAARASLRGQPREEAPVPETDAERDERRRAFRDVRKTWPEDEASVALLSPQEAA